MDRKRIKKIRGKTLEFHREAATVLEEMQDAILILDRRLGRFKAVENADQLQLQVKETIECLSTFKVNLSH